jgi:tRNA U34 5-methylaminomethyl-2-thiouridine-forming methyltransferase MnmC
MKEIKTRDGAVTFLNDIGDTYHSTTIGAIEEAFEKYVKPCEIKENSIILDFCFGLGYNSLAAITLLKRATIIGIDVDPKIIKKISEIEVPKEFEKKYNIIRLLAKNLKYKDDYYDLKLIVGDGKEVIKSLNKMFDCVLFDPFSPKLVPGLWSYDIFKRLYEIMNINAKITTYSCARKIRENLKKAGFLIKDGPAVGRKSPGTIAVKIK